jgi:hypothetical protein
MIRCSEAGGSICAGVGICQPVRFDHRQGLALTDLLISFHRLIRVGSRVRWYWLVPVLPIYLLLAIVAFWWGCYVWYLHIHTLTMSQFLPTLLAAIAIFLLAAALLPDEVPNDGLDLKTWYLQNSRQIWILASLALLLVVVFYAAGDITDRKSAFEFAKSEWENFALLAGSVALIFTKRLRVHELYVVIAVFDMAYSASVLRIG